MGIREKIKKAQLEIKKAKRKDYYKILDVKKDATESEIKKAYRKQALRWHPDKNSETEEQKEKADVMFKDIGEAYSVLSDPKKKQMYDDGHDIEEIENGGGHGFGGFDPNDIFQAFF